MKPIHARAIATALIVACFPVAVVAAPVPVAVTTSEVRIAANATAKPEKPQVPNDEDARLLRRMNGNVAALRQSMRDGQMSTRRALAIGAFAGGVSGVVTAIALLFTPGATSVTSGQVVVVTSSISGIAMIVEGVMLMMPLPDTGGDFDR